MRMDRLRQDLRFALRSLSRDRSFTLIALTTLALGIAATATSFTVTKSVLLNPLAFPDPDRLTMVWEHSPSGNVRNLTSAYNYIRWRDRAQSFESIGAIAQGPVNVSGLGEAHQVDGLTVTAGFFDALGIQPLLGRAITRADERVAPARVIVLGHAFWQHHFGGALDVLGKRVSINGTPREIVGVMPAGFAFPAARAVQLYSPMFIDPAAQPGGRSLMTVARLRPGVTLEAARADMLRVVKGMIDEGTPNLPRGSAASIFALIDETVGPMRRILWVVLGSVACLLVLACANVANLLLIRASKRTPELAVRVTLGASHWRLVQQLAIESLVLTCAAGTIGLGLGAVLIPAIPAMFPPSFPLPRAAEIRIDWTIAAFTLLVCCAIGLAFTLLPVARIVQGRLAAALRSGARSALTAHTRLRRVIVMAEVAIALVLVFAAALMGRSLSTLTSVDTGLESSRVMTASLLMVPARYGGPGDRSRPVTFMDRVLDQIRTTPGVTNASSIHLLPLSGLASGAGIWRTDRPLPAMDQMPMAAVSVVADGYFDTMGIPLRGRDFSRADRLEAPMMVVVNETAARRLFPGEDPIGRFVGALYSPDTRQMEIVGVAGDVRTGTLEREPGPAIYIPHSQAPSLRASLVVRGQGSPAVMATAVRQAIAAADPDQGIAEVMPLDTVVANAAARPRVQAGVFGVFGILALVIAAVGLYGVMAYGVEQRRREMGLRLALGAPPRSLVGAVIREGVGLAAFGGLAGTLLAWLASGSLEELLYQTQPTDSAILASVAGTLIVVAGLATLAPALRATRVDPLVVLRSE